MKTTANRNFDPLDVETQFSQLTGSMDALAALVIDSPALPRPQHLGNLLQLVADNARLLEQKVVYPSLIA